MGMRPTGASSPLFQTDFPASPSLLDIVDSFSKLSALYRAKPF
jgi:hypothetical protein